MSSQNCMTYFFGTQEKICKKKYCGGFVFILKMLKGLRSLVTNVLQNIFSGERIMKASSHWVSVS